MIRGLTLWGLKESDKDGGFKLKLRLNLRWVLSKEELLRFKIEAFGEDNFRVLEIKVEDEDIAIVLQQVFEERQDF